MSKKIVCVLGLLIACTAPTKNDDLEDPLVDVDSAIREDMDEDIAAPSSSEARVRLALRRYDVVVFLKTNANLTTITPALPVTRAERGKLVHHALVSHANAAQAGLLADVAAGGADAQAFHITNAVRVKGASLTLLRTLARRSDVRRIVLDRGVVNRLPAAMPLVSPAATRSTTTGIRATGADRVWRDFAAQGAAIVIGGQDTGVSWTHAALRSHYRGVAGSVTSHAYSWHDAVHAGVSRGNPCGYDIAAPCDDHGHGTHTIGTIVGDDGTSIQIGMAPAAKWIACRNMDEGVGRVSQYLECFEWFLAPYPQGANPRIAGDPAMAPHVINNSWGCTESEGCAGREFASVIEALERAGVVVVASAGNEGPACSTIGAQPATVSDSTLGVGAYNPRNGAIASFSSRGPSTLDGKLGPDVTAPGVDVYSAMPGGSYGFMSGTSMAGPHVVGAVALLLSADPTLIGNPAQVTQTFRTTAVPTTTTQSCGGVSGSSIPNNTWGFGKLDVYAAVAARRTP